MSVIVIVLGLMLAMMAAWGLQRAIGNAGCVDVVWSLALGGAGVAAGLMAPGPRGGVVALLAALWGLRLGGYILYRNWGHAEDSRYAALRSEWGGRFQARMFGFLQIQALAAAALAMSFIIAAHNPAPLGAQDALAAAVLLAGVAGGAIADGQLARFRRDPSHRGAICDAGLWRWSRHPNYFFEFLGWCCWPLLAIAPGYAWGWLALSAPALIYWFLVHVSGIPPLEAAMLRSRGELYRAYQARTHAFFPIPKRISR
jgi:steroid 5-alpha reductase family enzyme